ncbi:type IV pilin protein [Longimicrobium sp.]|uniref:type IV pilin protein n=1 Tax=Longimicrobium sp. TaxID=2029185 RepID=UPI002E373263|nr:prepilin-type N-terminal cleavage/methylation domain-containing protein [Longimicrobium sp.]HEX6037318.1 prepilin-type N-terminal cleavage/methylation domain-containing protein [Longimicrobium sp.]
MTHTLRRRSGFTLIELMIVLVIMGILAASAITKYRISAHRSHETEADVALGHLFRMQQVHLNEFGQFAASETELARVGYTPPVMKNFVWAGSVAIPQCLTSTGAWNSRRIELTGDIVDC